MHNRRSITFVRLALSYTQSSILCHFIVVNVKKEWYQLHERWICRPGKSRLENNKRVEQKAASMIAHHHRALFQRTQRTFDYVDLFDRLASHLIQCTHHRVSLSYSFSYRHIFDAYRRVSTNIDYYAIFVRTTMHTNDPYRIVHYHYALKYDYFCNKYSMWYDILSCLMINYDIFEDEKNQVISIVAWLQYVRMLFDD